MARIFSFGMMNSGFSAFPGSPKPPEEIPPARDTSKCRKSNQSFPALVENGANIEYLQGGKIKNG